MEADLNMSILDDFRCETSKLVLIQAWVRGYVTRQKLFNLRNRYEDLFISIERIPKHIKWNSNIFCKPTIVRQGKGKLSSRCIDDIKSQKESEQLASNRTDMIQHSSTQYEATDVPSVCVCSKKQGDKKVTRNRPTEIQNVPIVERNFKGSDNDIETERIIEINSPRDISSSGVCKTFDLENSAPGRLEHEKEPVKNAFKDKKVLEFENMNLLENEITEPVKLPRENVREDSMYADMTSVWDESKHFKLDITEDIANDVEKIKAMRESTALEVLWIQQAIDSRKNYLRLKEKV